MREVEHVGDLLVFVLDLLHVVGAVAAGDVVFGRHVQLEKRRFSLKSADLAGKTPVSPAIDTCEHKRRVKKNDSTGDLRVVLATRVGETTQIGCSRPLD